MRKFGLGFMILGLLAMQTAPAMAGVGFGLHGNALNFKLANDIVAKVSGTPSTVQGTAIQEVYGMGLGGGVHLDFGLPIISFRVSGDYLTIAPDNDKFRSYFSQISPILFANATVDGGRITMIGGNVNLKLNVLPLPVIKPYATGGVGLTNIKMDEVNVKTAFGSFKSTLLENQTVKTLNVGAGVDVELGGIALFGELKVNWIFLKEGTSVQLPIGTVGITF
jgi:hypothetical protein